MVISQKVIGRMSPNLVWHSFSTDPSCVANYKEIRRGHVNFMLIWYGMTPKVILVLLYPLGHVSIKVKLYADNTLELSVLQMIKLCS